ncbi:PROTEIN NPG1 [Salix purpurea]|uniref:PROTEIN NPG1 n=1 Tax=Salix purpurea TaxID=77065 RepID=A0A9Q0PG97_SALPP|nr:PROTEIN NPG1 [Salix purpurea]
MKSKFRAERRKGQITEKKPGRLMEGLSSGDQSRTVAGMALSSDPLATKDNSTGAYSSKNGALDQQPDTSNLEEAELSLRGRGSLNYEEARALLGRMEYQKGNVEAALHVFEGINIAAVTPRMKATLAKRREHDKRRSQSFSTPPMSIHAASLLMEAILLKAKSLQHLGRFREAAQSCKVIVDIVESSFSEGLPENFAADFKLQETLNKAVELLPELWKLADSPREAIMSYRRALLNQWNLDVETTARIQKDFAILLLYSGGEACPPNLRSQMDSSFVPKNNIEEAILLLMILLRKIILKRIERDPSILDHLSFALSVSGGLKALASQVEELLPGIINRNERYHILSLCYYGAGEELIALDLLRKLLHVNEDPNCVPALLMASKICGKTPKLAEEGINYARRALQSLENNCNQLESVAYCLLGVSLSAHSQVAVADSVRATKQFEALEALESAGRMTKMRDSNILYHLSLENAEQRKLDRQYKDAETIINAALDQTGKWDQGELLRTKAKLQIAQGQLESGIASYIQLLAVLRIQSKSLGLGTKLYKILQDNGNPPGLLELEVWHDLASVYIRLSRWHDAETCLSKSKAICSYSASRCHTTGVLYEGKGLYKEALKAFASALDIDPTHVPSMVSTAVVLRRLCMQSSATRSFLMGALRLDRMNSSAWYNLGLLYKAEGAPSSSLEAAECFEAATFLEETAPAEPFR